MHVGPDQNENEMKPRLARNDTGRKLLSRLWREQQGAELVEFALSTWILMTLFIGLIYTCFGFYSYTYTSNAAQAGTRFAIVHGGTWTTACSTSAPPNFSLKYNCTASAADVQNYLKAIAPPGIVPSQITVTTTWPGTTATCASGCTACASPNTAQSKGCMVKVLVSYHYALLPTLIPGSAFAFPLRATSEKTIAQ